ncbi:hemagglutination domain protein [Campylobacter peloridis]|uniref:Hemagglutination domain protein n=1 Tax=Campylobacter peloridis TaxID=488546 RepID=A0ABX6TWD6_9BACT|nr:filamentous hemagglutinin N-terminal domain-containing protein [Campylobacter peloridis]AJC84330.1 hemagglutinin domain-containing protein [Campylobacter peloridis LMG 23910]QOQ88429.1 hemagglutination domain protein [Campylobacter peloridis]
MAVFSPRGGGSNNFDLTPSKKLTNHILLSSIVASLLFSPAFALPSGGKFTHGTSGTINVSGNNMHIHGNKVNSVIQWGGGFNINKGESVNFGGNSKNYLNIAHGTNKSTIAGILNASGNNVFLINPNGVIITKTGNINANRFVASTSSMSNEDMNKFAKLNENQAGNFSPVFKPQKAGSVVNMGNINANDVLLIGHKVDIQGGKLGNANSKTHLVGNYVYIDADSANLNSIINVTAIKDGYIQRQMINFAKDGYKISNANINKVNYTDNTNVTHNGISSNFKKALTIGNMENEKANAIEWWHFAKGWNEGLGHIRSVDEFKLVGNIDFSGNKGKGEEGKDWQNYANYCISQGQCTSMIVGYDYQSAFNKIFNGQGFTLKNINIDTTKLQTVGIFGHIIRGGFFNNINIDYMGGGIKSVSADSLYVGGFAGYGGGSFTNIFLSNIGNISASADNRVYVGGFAGYGGSFTNIFLSNIGNISASASNIYSYAGGFAGHSNSATNIFLSNIGNISASADNRVYVGGFAGHVGGSSFTNIFLSNIGNISASADNVYSFAGGFVGYGGSDSWLIGSFTDIFLNNIGNINANNAGGFIGDIDSGQTPDGAWHPVFTNISLNDIGNIIAAGDDGHAGGFIGGNNSSNASGRFTNISLNDIGNIIAAGNYGHAGGFAGSFSGNFTNISLNSIGSISGKASTGGFVGFVVPTGNFTNISLNSIGSISGKASTGGFVGYVYDVRNLTFKNIYIFFNPNISITSEDYDGEAGKFFGALNDEVTYTFNNIHIYHHKDDLANATTDKNYWGNTNDKIQIHTYTDETQANAYKDFLSKANSIEKPNITPPTITPDNPNKPSDNDVILASDDLHQDIIQGIIDSIRNEKYTIDIKNLYSLIQAFKGLNKDSNENEIKTIVKTHLGIKDDDKALSIAQSISFLLHYNEINFNNKLDKTALELYNNQIKPNVFNTLEIITYLDTNKNNIIAQLQQYESIKNDFKIKEQAYFKAQAEFNKLLDLVNKGKLNYNDPKFTQAFDNWTKAYNAYNSLSNDIGELNSKVNQYTQYINTTLGYKQFAFVKFDNIIKTDLTKPILPDIDNSLGGDKQPVFEQTASLNLIGDNAIEEEEEKKEIEETALTQRARTCIVSDNFKTMNPCVVESY